MPLPTNPRNYAPQPRSAGTFEESNQKTKDQCPDLDILYLINNLIS
jgi:hypothetical protein